MLRTLTRLIPLAAAALLAACTDDPSGPAPVDSVQVTAAADSATVGATLQLSASTRDRSGAELAGRAVEWSSDNPAIARVDAGGLVTAVAPGEATITARSEEREGQRKVRVVPVRAAKVELGRTQLIVATGQSFQFSPVITDAAGQPLAGRPVLWATEDSTFVRITQNGLITALRPGRGAVSALVDGVPAVVHVLVFESGLHAWPDTVSLNPGNARGLVARAIMGRGEPVNLDTATWTSSDPSVARVDAAGVVTAMGNGRATITASVGNARVSSEVYVSSYPKPLRFNSVVTGSFHSCGLTAEGEAYCWGSDERGQLGIAQPASRCETFAPLGRGGVMRITFRCSALPVRVAGPRFASLSANTQSTCGLTPEGAAYCWGDSYSSANREPALVPGGIVFRSVSAGTFFACGVSTSGEGYCWGENNQGQLGNGNNSSSAVPVRVAGGLSFASLQSGSSHSCGIAADGAAYCWGQNIDGELGAGLASLTSNVPVRVAGGINFRSVDPSSFLTCALDVAGRAYCWGSGVAGRLGDGRNQSSTTPVAVAGGLTFESISVNTPTCAVTADGSTYCWGRNSTTPVRSEPDFPVRLISVGGVTTCSIALDGLTYCAGTRYYGQAGDGVFDSKIVGPMRVAGQ
jgi:alpha-tubulin suppressor-like RCC1 family protein